MYIYIYVCAYAHIHILVCIVHTYIYICRWASRLVCIFCLRCRSLSLFGFHFLLLKLSGKLPICFPRSWNLGIKVWTWNLWPSS